uniref:Uncharacterized protein n=1 Tax=Romanomermis culicivorax TaxID=13658 RepID=A0A915L8X7_ROMCU
MWNDFNPSPRYWGQWESHYGPAQRRVATRRHQAEAMFGPIVGQRPPVAIMGPAAAVGFVPAAIVAPVGMLDHAQQQNRQLYYDFNGEYHSLP